MDDKPGLPQPKRDSIDVVLNGRTVRVTSIETSGIMLDTVDLGVTLLGSNGEPAKNLNGEPLKQGWTHVNFLKREAA